MGKLGRFACIIFPQAATLIALALTVWLQTSTRRANLGVNTYFYKLDTRYIGNPDAFKKIPKNDKGYRAAGLNGQTEASKHNMADFYLISLYNQCEGSFSINDADEGVWKIESCGKVDGRYHFNASEILLESDAFRKGDLKIPSEISKTASSIKSVSIGMNFCFVVAALASAVTFVVGWFGLLSRWGSCVTGIFANIASLAAFCGALIATTQFAAIRAAFLKTQLQLGVGSDINQNALGIAWAAWIFNVIAVIFWALSTCCCSGRTKKVMGNSEKPTRGQQAVLGSAARGYQPVDPYHSNYAHPGQGGVPMQNLAYQGQQSGTYEPFRNK